MASNKIPRKAGDGKILLGIVLGVGALFAIQKVLIARNNKKETDELTRQETGQERVDFFRKGLNVTQDTLLF